MSVDTYATGDDRVQLRLGTLLVKIASEYDTKSGIFDQPSTFSFVIGDGSTAASLIQQAPANTPFQILVGGAPQFTGFTEGREARGSATQGTQLHVHGRSILAKLLTDLEKNASFTGKTHRDLVAQALSDLDIKKPFTNDAPQILASNADTRKTRSGTNVKASDADDYTAQLSQYAGTQGDAYPVARTKLAEKYLDLLRRHLETVGLFLWDSPTGDIIVGRPNWHQPAIARIYRRRSRVPTSNIESYSWREDYAPRYSEVAIFGKTTGRKYSRHTTSGAYTDDIMVNLGFHKVKVVRDVNVTSIAHAEAIAKKHLAEGRRKGFALEYTVKGHSTPNILTGGTTIWSPDTVVDVVDEEIGISGQYYIENVRHTRNANGTHTTIKLLEPDSLIFGEESI